ncbi:MAG: homoserine O-acetyltransferase [Flavobacteriales bacterium]
MKKYLHKRPFELESGAILPEIEIAYHTYGNLNSAGDNVVWVCHALTANSDVFEWWKGLFGETDLFNPNAYFIVCDNVLGGCYGTTGPLSMNPLSGKAYYHDFPFITIRDIVGAHDLLRKELGIQKIAVGVGGSLGGQQMLEWNIGSPELFENTILIATNAVHSPWGIAFNEAQRMAIQSDPTWNLATKRAGIAGLKAARAIALLSYRNYEAYRLKQSEDDQDMILGFKAAGYQQYQGKKLIDRFNSYTYWRLSAAMDSHHVGRKRNGLKNALKNIQARVLIIGIKDDILFPNEEQRLLANEIPDSEFQLVTSDFGHDGFLIETEKLSQIISDFLNSESNENEVLTENNKIEVEV